MNKQKGKILVVEDNSEMLEISSRLLKSEGYETINAVNGKNAWIEVKKSSPDLILLDVVLPDYDGIDLCREIKQHKQYKTIPVIIISGLRISIEDEAKGLEAGAEDYLIRPISNKRLVARVNNSVLLYNTLKELMHINRKWQSIFANTNDAIMLLDKNFVVKVANQTMARLFNTSIENMLGRHCWEIVHETETALDICPANKIKESKMRESIELALGKKWYLVNLDPVIIDNEIDGYVHIITDITERKTAEQKLAKYTTQLEQEVQKRTVALENRNRELEEKNQSLEQYHDLFVQREFRIKELKDEIEKISNQLKLLKQSKI